MADDVNFSMFDVPAVEDGVWLETVGTTWDLSTGVVTNWRNGEITERLPGRYLYEWEAPPGEACETYWGSHGCHLAKGHDGWCMCDDDPTGEDGWDGNVGAFPYYGPDTQFYGDDAPERQARFDEVAALPHEEHSAMVLVERALVEQRFAVHPGYAPLPPLD